MEQAIRWGLRWGLLALVAVLALGYLGVGLFVASRLSIPVRQPNEPRTEGDLSF